MTHNIHDLVEQWHRFLSNTLRFLISSGVVGSPVMPGVSTADSSIPSMSGILCLSPFGLIRAPCGCRSWLGGEAACGSRFGPHFARADGSISAPSPSGSSTTGGTMLSELAFVSNAVTW